MNTALESVRLLVSSPTHYSTRLAHNADEVRAAQALRYQVFNLELNEGLEQSHLTGLDEDQFDFVCDHLIVEHLPTGHIVGTYRLQTGQNAAAYLGYYCAQEVECGVFEPMRAKMVELGRACVHRQHRNLVVLGCLWKGIAAVFLIVLGLYLACGLVLAIPFALVGARMIDPHASHGSWGFRLLIVPGPMALWPLLLRRWASGVHEPPEERNAHRRQFQPHLATLKPRARSETLQNHQLTL